jgi:hypothetical protein
MLAQLPYKDKGMSIKLCGNGTTHVFSTQTSMLLWKKVGNDIMFFK